MYQNNSQVGRTRVNKIREGKKNPPGPKELYKKDGLQHIRPRSSVSIDIPQYKKVGQIKDKKITAMDKLYHLQDELFLEGLTLDEYKDYVQDKINSEKYYYKNLSVKNVAELNKRYRRLVMKKENEYRMIGEKKELKRRQNKLFRQKRKKGMDQRKHELIDNLFKFMKKSKSIGHIKDTSILSTNPDDWLRTKTSLFSGGRYLDSNDKDWGIIYQRLNSINSAHLLNLHSSTEIYDYVFLQ